MLKICPRHAQDMPWVCPSYAQDMAKICLRYARDMPEKYAKKIGAKSPLNLQKLGQNVLGQNVHYFFFTKVGAKCPGVKCPWGKMSPSPYVMHVFAVRTTSL